MKLSGTTPNYINQTYTNQTNIAGNQNLKSQQPNEEIATDSLSLSTKTKDLQKISKVIETEPTDRKQYVADIKQKIENDQYDLNAESVANKILGHFMDEIV